MLKDIWEGYDVRVFEEIFLCLLLQSSCSGLNLYLSSNLALIKEQKICLIILNVLVQVDARK